MMNKINTYSGNFRASISKIKAETEVPLKQSVELNDKVNNDNIKTLLDLIDLDSVVNQNEDLSHLQNVTNATSLILKQFNNEIIVENAKVFYLY